MTSITRARGAAATGVLLLSGCLLLCACSAGSSSPTAASAGVPAVAHGPAVGYAASGRDAANGPATSTTQAAKIVPASQSIIYTASLTIRSASAMATANKAIAIVTAAGGYTAGENAVAGTAGQPGGSVSLTLRIPVAVYQLVLGELSAPSLGKQVSLTQQATDVTEQVANVDSLVTSQEAAITALDGLLGHAATVSQLLQVQQQISTDESTLNSLQAQQSALEHETSYATVTMTLLSTQRHHAARKHKATHRGFLAGLGAGWRALRHATTWLLTALGAALPFLVLAAILAAAGYLGRRRFTRRGTGPTAVG